MRRSILQLCAGIILLALAPCLSNAQAPKPSTSPRNDDFPVTGPQSSTSDRSVMAKPSRPESASGGETVSSPARMPDGMRTARAQEYYLESPDDLIVDNYPRGRPTLFGRRYGATCGWNPELWYGSVGFKLWQMEGMFVPALLTTSPLGTERPVAGVLGESTTTILYGDRYLSEEVQPGGEFRVGRRFAMAPANAVEFSYLALGGKSYAVMANTADYAILARPFNNVEPDFEGQDAELVSYPGFLDGEIEIYSQSDFQALEVLYRRQTRFQSPFRIAFVTGWRSMSLDDELGIRDFKTALSGDSGLVVGTTLNELDRFASNNDFNGWTVGLDVSTERDRWTFQALGKIGIGNTRSQVAIDGFTMVTVPVPGAAADVNTSSAGLLAQSTNIGVHQTDDFSIVPELTLTAAYQLTPRWRATVGYSIIYWSNVARAGEQIDTGLNLSQLEPDGLVGPSRPQFVWQDSNFWIQGLNLGLDCRY